LSRNKGYFELFKKAIEEKQFDIEQIDHLFVNYAVLFDRAQQNRPDLIETTAFAAVLHSFHSGLELIFSTIAKRIDQQLPTGDKWHRQLLFQMTQHTAQRTRVILEELAQSLGNYLAFRHFYRHSYSFYLDWHELEKLVIPLHVIWAQVRSELQSFLDTLSSA
jgi:ribonuclease HepT-like protein